MIYASETWVLKETIIQKLLVFWEENSKQSIWAQKRKSNMESQNQRRIRQADKTKIYI
jgi:hypothetical protein